MNGWSPSKLASLNFFLSGVAQAKPGPSALAEPAAALPLARAPVQALTLAPTPMPSFDPVRSTEVFRPYQGLKALLRAGPGGLVSGGGSGTAGPNGFALGLPQQPGSSTEPLRLPVAGPSFGGAAGRPPLGNSLRYNPYGRPKYVLVCHCFVVVGWLCLARGYLHELSVRESGSALC